jgi:outer membrane lipoprotein-sorting protein
MFPEPLMTPNRPRTLAWAALALLLVATAALADARLEMQALGRKFLAAKSYHAVMTSSDTRVPQMEMDFVAPDRYRMTMPMGTQVVIGDTMYMSIDGRTMRIPMPKGTLTQWRQPGTMMSEIDKNTYESLGTELVNGKPCRKFRMVPKNDPSTTTLVWVGADGWPAKIETTGKSGRKAITTTITYSRFNDPSIKIDAPR